jgi:2-polyprenyl-6-methoxyphenol hydroxylase-like FAD-dependent oxidoreductase
LKRAEFLVQISNSLPPKIYLPPRLHVRKGTSIAAKSIMEDIALPTIAGAGPVGLAAALFLSHRGIPVRIIDAAPHKEPHSRALAVNPRTLEILEATGITSEMLSIGKIIRGAHIWSGTKTVAQISLDSIHHRYPFMLALSQAVTERLLEEHLNRLGVRVQWNHELTRCQNSADDVHLQIKSLPEGTIETSRCPWLLAADGAHSAARKSLDIEFKGSTFENPWHLVDVPLSTTLPEDNAHVIFYDDGGFIFLIRVIDDPGTQPAGDPVWRIIANFPDPLTRFETGNATGPALWQSAFHIAHRINERLQDGQVYFAGDAAHVHSPMGARGMNLGIEDAWVFSQLLHAGQLGDYGEQRYKVDRRVVRRIEVFSRVVRGESATARLLRENLVPVMMKIPASRHRIVKVMAGLDHDLPELPAKQPN